MTIIQYQEIVTRGVPGRYSIRPDYFEGRMGCTSLWCVMCSRYSAATIFLSMSGVTSISRRAVESPRFCNVMPPGP